VFTLVLSTLRMILLELNISHMYSVRIRYADVKSFLLVKPGEMIPNAFLSQPFEFGQAEEWFLISSPMDDGVLRTQGCRRHAGSSIEIPDHRYADPSWGKNCAIKSLPFFDVRGESQVFWMRLNAAVCCLTA
jgi:hypothetical protein